MVIRENDIYERVASVVRNGLSALGVTGVDVPQQHQPLQTNGHSCVMISRVDTHRYGWQGTLYDPKGTPEHDKTLEKTTYHDEVTFQVSAYVPRSVTDETRECTAYDIVSALASWLMSRSGILEMNERSLQILRISEIRNPVSQDDSNTPQFNPNFDLRFIVRQQMAFKIPVVSAAEIARYGVGEIENITKIDFSREGVAHGFGI